jgi:hypothetical protein
MQKYAICFLTIDIKKELFEFAETLIDSNYDVFICLDNNEIDTSIYNETKITFVSINNEEAKNNGFYGSVSYCSDRACSRDKALYYFAKINKTTFDFTWFIEEDVFIPNKNTIKNIDLKYSNCNYDLLSEINEIKESNNDKSVDWYHYHAGRLENKIDFPWAHSMICAVRISNKLLNIISDFAYKNKFLLYDECLFNTLALQNNLNIYNPIELSNIIFLFNDIEINENNINRSYLYHPLKNLKKHEYLHEIFINDL